MPTKLPTGYWRVMSLLITVHGLYDTYTEYRCYMKHWNKFRQQLQLYDKISSSRFHYRQ